MTTQELAQKLAGYFKDVAIECVEGVKHPITGVKVGDDFLVIPAGKLTEICQKLAEIDQFSFDCLSNLTAVDRLKDPSPRFDVVYNLFSYKNRHSLTLKVYLPRDVSDAGVHVETVEKIWGVANWLEREVYDLFGIIFDGHSDLRRIMLPDDWEGHPLRKDYQQKDEYRGTATTRPSMLQ